MPNSILLIDDDVTPLRVHGAMFERAGWDVLCELTGESGLSTYERTLPEVVLVDLHLPGMDGLEVLERLRGRDVAVVMVTGDGDVSKAVQAMRTGAENFLVKPVDMEHLLAAAERAAEKIRLRRLNRTLVGQATDNNALAALGTSPAMRELRRKITSVAKEGGRAVLIKGEPGTGKGTIARLLHDNSLRFEAPYLEALCSTDDPAALEATVFGVEGFESGSSRQGLLEIADGGTLYLEEIGAAQLGTQARLAQAMDVSAFRRSGGTREIPVDTWLIASATQDVGEMVSDGRFSNELFYRLAATTLTVPPLRERGPDDVLAAVQQALRVLSRSVPGVPFQIDDEARERLLAHSWPGNLREVRHVIERAMLLARGQPAIGIAHLPVEFRARPGPFDRRHNPLTIEEVERMHIERTLKHHTGNRTRAATELGISRATLIAKIKRYAIPQ
jgi:two-component system response regulator HydG